MPQPIIIKTAGLAKSYTVGKNKVRALAKVDLEIATGDFVVIYGPSGSGKTTLLSLLAGLEKPSEGEVVVDGIDINSLDINTQAKFRSAKIGMVFQQFNLVSALNSRDNVAMPLLLRGIWSGFARRQADKYLEQLGMSDRKKHKPSELSGGQQQRVAIARALVTKPKILLVDEPTGNLDIPTGQEIIELLTNINKKSNTTIILVTHNPDFIKSGNRVIYMEDGKIIKDEQTNSHLRGGESVVTTDQKLVDRGHLSFWEAFRLARIHFSSKGFRAFLTTLGVALGVGSVVALVSLGIGLQNITSSQIASFNDLVSINVSANKNSSAKLDDANVSRISALQHVILASPAISMPAGITIDSSSSQVAVSGIKPETLNFEGVVLAAGQNYTENSGVIVTKSVAKSFNKTDLNSLVGKDITLNLIIGDASDLTKAKVIDVPEKITGVSNDELSANAYLSLSKMKQISSLSNYNSVKVKVDNRKNVEGVKNSIEAFGFDTNSVVDLINKIDKVFFITQVALGIIGGIALLISLIGIVNIMTVALLERTHEVGVLKAIGATGLDIRRIFEYEVILYGFWGALFGVAGAWSLGWIINSLIIYVMKTEGIVGDIKLFVTPMLFAILMVVLTILISLLGGWFPAKKAAKLSAMEALRYE